MAYYEYECKQCDNVFTIKQSFEEHDRHPRVKCPECGATDVEQLIGSVNLKTAKKS